MCGAYFGYIFMALFSVACGLKKKKKTLLMDENEGFLFSHCTSSSVLSVHHNDEHALAGVFEVDSWMLGKKKG